LSAILTKPSPETRKEPLGSLNIQNNWDLTPIYGHLDTGSSPV
jgi:hypothetical protein